MAERVYTPRWHCRLHIWHRWRTYRASEGGGEYGGQYQQCLDCGKYRDVPIGGGIGPADPADPLPNSLRCRPASSRAGSQDPRCQSADS